MSPRTKGRDPFPPPASLFVVVFVLVSPSVEEEGEEGGAPRSQPMGNELITAVAVEEGGGGRDGGEEAEDEAEDEEEDSDDGDQCDDDDDAVDGLPFLPGEVDGGEGAEPVPSATTMRSMDSPIPVACSAASPASVWVGAVVASSGAAARAADKKTTARTSVAATRRGSEGIATSKRLIPYDFEKRFSITSQFSEKRTT